MMMGIEPARQREMMDEALGVLVPLMRGETVTAKTDWFTLNEARLHLAPYTRPSVEIAVANQISPTGARAAGKHGISLLSLGRDHDRRLQRAGLDLGDRRGDGARTRQKR